MKKSTTTTTAKITISWDDIKGDQKKKVEQKPEKATKSIFASRQIGLVSTTIPKVVNNDLSDRQTPVKQELINDNNVSIRPMPMEEVSIEKPTSKPKIIKKEMKDYKKIVRTGKPLKANENDIKNAIFNLTNKKCFETIKELKTFSKLTDIAQVLLSENERFVIGGPTGSGKTVGTSALLAHLMDNYDPDTAHTIYISIPLIVGVTSVYKHLQSKILSKSAANKVGFAAGGTVNYNKTNPVRIATTNHVFNRLAKMLNNPNECNKLNGLLVLVDEAHTPTMENYLLISLCLYIQEQGYSLRIGVMSATLDSAPLLDEFENYPKIELEGHMFNTKIVYHSFTPDEDKELIPIIINKIREYSQQNLNMLVFVSGEKPINDIMKNLKNDVNLDVCALFSRMPKEEMDLAFESAPKGKVKVVISTNMTESSVTIPNMDLVIDSGKEIVAEASKTGRAMKYVERWVSQASAKQRAGRVGRTKTGLCYRIWTETHEQINMKKHSESDFFRINPEIQVLKLISLNLDSKAITRLDNIRHTMIMKRLIDINLITLDGNRPNITKIGERALEFQVTLDIAVALAHLSQEKDITTKIVGLCVMSLIEGCGGFLPFWARADIRGDIAKHGFDVDDAFQPFKGEDDIETFFNILFNEDGVFSLINHKKFNSSDRKKISETYREWSKENHMNNKQIKGSIILLRQLSGILFPNDENNDEISLLNKIDDRIFNSTQYDYKEKIINVVRSCLIKAFPGEKYTPCELKYGNGYTDGNYKYMIDKRRSYCSIMDTSIYNMPSAYPLSISQNNKGTMFVSGIIKTPKSV